MCNVYRRFVPNFARLAAPLNELLKKGQPVTIDTLNDAQADAFTALRNCLLNPPVLALPRREGYFTLDTDATETQLGSCLLQDQQTGDRMPVGYWSRSLTPAEKNYSTTEKECLAVVWSVLMLRPYLEGTRFTVRTDYHALRCVLAGSRTESHGRLERWRLRLLEFDFEVQYRPGRSHHAADVMFRMPTAAEDTDPIEEGVPVLPVFDPVLALETARRDRLAADAELTPITSEEFLREQATDTLCLELANRNDSMFDYNEVGLLVRLAPLDGARQVVMPKSLQPRVLRIAHYPRLVAHQGSIKMYHTLRRVYYWPGMAQDVDTVVRSCTDCARYSIKERSRTSFCKIFPTAAVGVRMPGPIGAAHQIVPRESRPSRDHR